MVSQTATKSGLAVCGLLSGRDAGRSASDPPLAAHEDIAAAAQRAFASPKLSRLRVESCCRPSLGRGGSSERLATQAGRRAVRSQPVHQKSGVVAASASPREIARLRRSTVFATDDVVHLTTPERVMLVHEAVLANLIGAFGDLPAERLADLTGHEPEAAVHVLSPTA